MKHGDESRDFRIKKKTVRDQVLSVEGQSILISDKLRVLRKTMYLKKACGRGLIEAQKILAIVIGWGRAFKNHKHATGWPV